MSAEAGALHQPIQHHGKLAALVADDTAIVPDALTGRDRVAVKAKCLFAIQIHSGERPGPYTDTAAQRYVQHALARRPIPGRRRHALVLDLAPMPTWHQHTRGHDCHARQLGRG